MFKLKDYNGAHIEVKCFEDFTFSNSSYVPVLRQLESAKLQRFYVENKLENGTKYTTNMNFRNPKYLSILNHLRFYLPGMYPKLHRILFLDDDVVVQRDLTGLWEIDMDGKVNGALETSFGSFHWYAQYVNFSHPLIKEKFNPKACGWAYGMNFFDLDAWKKEKNPEQYHYWQNLNENRTLWKLGTLPPGLISTFYSTAEPLDKSWHVLGLGYRPSTSMDEIGNAAVVSCILMAIRSHGWILARTSFDHSGPRARAWIMTWTSHGSAISEHKGEFFVTKAVMGYLCFKFLVAKKE